MKLPLPLFLKSIQEKKIYFFRDTSFGVSKHMHICLKVNGNVLYFMCCTTKYKTIERFLQKQNIDYSTIVHIAKDPTNCFDETDTYINCNSVYECTSSDFAKAYIKDQISFVGEVSENHYYQILKGIHNSPMVAEFIKESLD